MQVIGNRAELAGFTGLVPELLTKWFPETRLIKDILDNITVQVTTDVMVV